MIDFICAVISVLTILILFPEWVALVLTIIVSLWLGWMVGLVLYWVYIYIAKRRGL